MKKKMSALLAVMTVFMSAIMISALLANNTKSVDANEEQTNDNEAQATHGETKESEAEEYTNTK